MGYYLAVANIILSVGACIGYLVQGDYRYAIYWGSAALLTSSVTF